ncbi:MAG TPA: saccharopine dehydrogenase NADP-binding domain-containing protein, partial [Vicinamibacteria bacterium]|nr:saccharopine dehydrogenase NADP-binding domain-containing protein [Vicinamibacteria bacterium]
MSERFVIYGANGYTGELAARESRRRGLAPVLAGRNAQAVAALAGELGLEHAAFALDDPAAVEAGLRGAAAVLHCAGPFSHTAGPMAEACLRAGVHYLDVTGEIEVFEKLAARDGEARSAGVMLLPGTGFDVVPSDCLAAHLKRRLPAAVQLRLAFASRGGVSRGTATTAAENIHRGGVVRKDGALTPVPTGWKTREVDFGEGLVRTAVTIPWGDIATAWRSTGIPDIEVYMVVPPSARRAMKLVQYARPLLEIPYVRSTVRRLARRGAAGPDAEARARGWT